MHTEQQLFKELDDLIKKKYDLIPLVYLDEIEIDSKHPLSFYSEIIGKKKSWKEFDSIQFYEDLLFINKDIKYFTGLLYFLRPYINNPLKENRTYFQNIFDKRYLSYASVVHQCVYNYWDRIGDLLYMFFETGLDERRVYLGNVINKFPLEYKDSQYFHSLKQLYDTKIKPLLEDRNAIVHYSHLESKMYSGTFSNYRDTEKLKELQTEKESYPEMFKEHLETTLQGYEIALKLIDELPDK